MPIGTTVTCTIAGSTRGRTTPACMLLLRTSNHEPNGTGPDVRTGAPVGAGAPVAQHCYSMQLTQPSTSVPSKAIWRMRM